MYYTFNIYINYIVLNCTALIEAIHTNVNCLNTCEHNLKLNNKTVKNTFLYCKESSKGLLLLP